jgi:hypothetical protein
MVHSLLDGWRVNPRREFFRARPGQSAATENTTTTATSRCNTAKNRVVAIAANACRA